MDGAAEKVSDEWFVRGRSRGILGWVSRIWVCVFGGWG